MVIPGALSSDRRAVSAGSWGCDAFAAVSRWQMQWPYHTDSSIQRDSPAICLVLIRTDLKKVILQSLVLLNPTAKQTVYLETWTFRVFFFFLISVRFVKLNLKMCRLKMLLSFQNTALNIWGNSNSGKIRTELEFTTVEIADNCSLVLRSDRILQQEFSK